VAKAIIAGASGLIGGLLLDILLQSPAYQHVVILVRKELPVQHKKLKQLVVDFEAPGSYAAEITGHAIFSCLGSTRKKTPDPAVYRKIDHDYPLQLAQMGVKNGVNQYHLVSALGANPASSTFYLKTKGETEEAIKKAGVACFHIYQPSLLTGDRKENGRTEEGIATVIMKIINPLLIGSLKKYRSIAAETVAMAMYKQSLNHQEGLFIHPSDQIKELA
jgi:uncharacterized protein YbjT (DUF2867 family)